MTSVNIGGDDVLKEGKKLAPSLETFKTTCLSVSPDVESSKDKAHDRSSQIPAKATSVSFGQTTQLNDLTGQTLNPDTHKTSFCFSLYVNTPSTSLSGDAPSLSLKGTAVDARCKLLPYRPSMISD